MASGESIVGYRTPQFTGPGEFNIGSRSSVVAVLIQALLRESHAIKKFAVKENPNIANESVHAQAREALKKYLHYFERVSPIRVI